MARQALVAVIALWLSVACSGQSETCLSGDRGCEEAAMCGLYVGKLGDLPGGLDLGGAEETGVEQ